MKTILTWLAKLNVWYENLAEPKRFIITLLIVALPAILVGLFAIVSNEGIFLIPAFLWFLVFLAYRAWWLYGNLDKYLYK